MNLMFLRLAATLAIILSLFEATKAQTISADNLKAVSINLHLSFDIAGQGIKNSDRTLFLFFCDDYWILKEPYKSYESGSKSDTPKFVGNSYYYFIGRNGSESGLAYDSKKLDKVLGVIKIDSMIKSYLSFPQHFYPPATEKIGITKNIKNGESIEKARYTPISGDQDSVFFYYKKSKNGISFFNASKTMLDLSLYKCEVTFKRKTVGGIEQPNRNYLFEIAESPESETERILNLIQQFKKDSDTRILKRINK